MTQKSKHAEYHFLNETRDQLFELDCMLIAYLCVLSTHFGHICLESFKKKIASTVGVKEKTLFFLNLSSSKCISAAVHINYIALWLTVKLTC